MIYSYLDIIISILALFLTLIIFLNLDYKKNIFKFILGYIDFFLMFFSTFDENEKIKKFRYFLNIILKNFLILVIKSIITLTPFILIFLIEIKTHKIEIINIVLSFHYIVLSGIIFVIFFKLKQKKIHKQYDEINRIIHKLIVNNFPLLKFTFNLEKKFFLQKIEPIRKIFITGYARSGTTHLLNEMYKYQYFSSLTYKNLPFIFSPKLNSYFIKIFSNKKENDFIARAHNDGLKISINSPEAFEEIFWKFILKNSFVKKDHLIKHNLENKVVDEFNKYINLVTSKNKIYLSKNNNNILRINDLSKIENSKFIIMFRNPFDHANSLLKQHKNFIKLQNEQVFVREYMSSLGHYEFGQDHKPFFYNKNNYNINSINYWIVEWIKFYKEILTMKKNKNSFLISYDKCCIDKNYINSKLKYILNLDFDIEFNFIDKPENKKIHTDLNKNILFDAENIHSQLLKID